MSLFPQRCKVCGKRDKFNFHVSDEVWAAVVPYPYQSGVVCLSCFDSFASMRGIEYADRLFKEVFFAGDAASFTMKVIKREEAQKC